MDTFADVITTWPSCAELGRDINEADITVRQWKTRGSIPASKWAVVLAAAAKRAATAPTGERKRWNEINADLFVRIANRKATQ